MLLFAAVGERPFEDSIFTIWPDGSHLRSLLVAKGRRSYVYASGNSLLADLIVRVHEAGDEKLFDHLYLYRPQTKEWRRLVSLNALEGDAVLAPDSSRAVASFAPSNAPGSYRLWLVSVDGKAHKLTGDERPDEWDAYPAWRPDGREIAFIRMKRSSNGLRAKPMVVSVEALEPAALPKFPDPAAAVCYAPNGSRMALLSPRGIEVLGLLDGSRDVIVPLERLRDHVYRGGGLTWSKADDALAIPLLNTQTGLDELWWVSTAGGTTRPIHTVRNAHIMGLTFIWSR